MTAPTILKPRRPAAAPKRPPTLTDREMLNDDEQKALYDELDGMRSEELVKTAGKLGLTWENVPKGRLIEQIIAVEIDRTRALEATARKLKAREVVGPTVPSDPDVTDGVMMMTPQDLAIVFAALLPPDAVWTPFAGSAQTYSKSSVRFEQGNAVTFSHRSSDGHERRYRIRFADLTPLAVEALP